MQCSAFPGVAYPMFSDGADLIRCGKGLQTGEWAMTQFSPANACSLPSGDSLSTGRRRAGRQAGADTLGIRTLGEVGMHSCGHVVQRTE